MTNQKPANGGGGGSSKDTLAHAIGIIALILFAVFTAFLLTQVDNSELHWSRMVYLFGSVEAVALAAAGYFFGREVHREKAEEAKKETVEAKAEKAATEKRNSLLLNANSVALAGLDAIKNAVEEKQSSRQRDAGSAIHPSRGTRGQDAADAPRAADDRAESAAPAHLSTTKEADLADLGSMVRVVEQRARTAADAATS